MSAADDNTRAAGSPRASTTPAMVAGRPRTGVDVAAVQLIPLELLHRSPYQVRREGDVTELAEDIRAHGLVNPITVRKRRENDGFEVVAGHRRWAAMQLVDPEGDVPCIVLDVDDRTAEELLVAENFVRADLSIMEQAETVALLTEHGRTAEECGRVCKRSVRWAHRMRAIGGIGEPWRNFFHVAGLPYADVLAVARLPEALREEAWAAFWRDVAIDLTEDEEVPEDLANDLFGQNFATIRGQLLPLAREEDERAESHAGDLEERLRTDAGLRAFLHESPANGPRFAEDDTASPIGSLMSRLRVLDDAPFDLKGCASCPMRTDAAPDLWGEDDGRAAPARCLDGACWRKRCAEHVALEVEEAFDAGVTSKPIRSSDYDWRDANELAEALKSAGGDATRVTPVIKTHPQTGEPTGRVLWRVAPKPAAPGGVAGSDTPPPKREPWEEWRPENPRWLPMLMGDKRDRAWFAVGLATGASMHEDERAAWVRHAFGEAGEDALHLVVRSNRPDVPWPRREVLIADLWRLLDAPTAAALLDAKQAYLAALEAAKGEEGEK